MKQKRDPDKLRQHQRTYYYKHKDSPNFKRDLWRKANPEYCLVATARQRAKKRGIIITISKEDIIIPETCPVLNIPIICGQTRLSDNSPTIDRIDSSKGYTPDNIAVISMRANRIKNDGSLEEHEAIVNWLKERKNDN